MKIQVAAITDEEARFENTEPVVMRWYLAFETLDEAEAVKAFLEEVLTMRASVDNEDVRGIKAAFGVGDEDTVREPFKASYTDEVKRA